MNNWLLVRMIGLACIAGLSSGTATGAADGHVLRTTDLAVPHAFVSHPAAPQHVVLQGVTAYAPRDLLSYAAAHDLTSDGIPTIEGTLDSIEQVYREDGYLLAEAVATLDPATGAMVVTVHEGHIEHVEVTGLDADRARGVQHYFDDVIGQKPLHAADFERALMLASDLTGLDLRSEFVFGPDREGATLRLVAREIKEAGSLSMDNVPLPGTDAIRVFAVQEFYSLATEGDLVRVLGVGTYENDAWSLAGTAFYRRPLGSRGTYLEAYAGNAFSRRSYTQVDGRTDQYGVNAALAVGHALRRDLHHYVYVLGEYEYMDAESRLGTGDIESIAHAGRVHLVGSISDDDGGQLMGSLAVSAGTRPERSALLPEDGDRHFTQLRGSLGLIEPLDGIHDRLFLRVEAYGQWTEDRLPEVEKFAIGHWPYLRGYVPAEALGDSGIAGTAELSYVFDAIGTAYRSIAPFVFFDAGQVSDNRNATAARTNTTLTSAGLGVFASLAWASSVSAWVATPLEDGTVTESGDIGFYLSLTKGWGR